MEQEQQAAVTPPSISPEQLEAERQQRLNAERTAMQAIAYAQGLQQQIQTPPQATYETDLWADDPQKLAAQVEERAMERAKQISEATIAPVVQTYVANQRAMNERFALTDPTMPHFQEWKKDIDFVLASVDPALAVKPEALQAAYKLVSSFHPEVLVEDELKKRKAQEEREEGEPPRQQQVYERDDLGMPVSSARGPAPARSPAKVKLTREEHVWAERFDATPEEFRYYQENDSEDIFGFKGRRRV